MGFYLGAGATMSCRVKDGFIEVESTISRLYETSIPINTDWQCNLFVSPWVFFVLYDDEKVYIGVNTGEVMVITTDGIVVSLYTWTPPTEDLVFTVGYYCDNTKDIYKAVVYLNEPRAVRILGLSRTYILNKGLDALGVDLYSTTPALKLSQNLRNSIVKTGFGLSITESEDFDEREDGYWEVNDESARIHAIRF